MPPVQGFRRYGPKAELFLHPFTGAVIATPVLDLDMMPNGLVVPDQSAYGNNGNLVNGPVGSRGVFDTALKFGGIAGATSFVNCGSNASLDIAGDISAGCWVKNTGSPLAGIMAKTDGATGWGLYMSAGGLVQAYFYNGALLVSGTSSLLYRWAHVFLAVKTNVYRLFADGLQESRGACVMSDAPAANLFVQFPTWPFPGSIELPRVFSGALSPEQVYRNYLAAKDVPIYYDTFESYAVTPVAKAVGSMCGPFIVTANSLVITVDAAGKKWVRGGVPAYCSGIGTYSENNAYGTYELDYIKGHGTTDTPYFGLICNNRVPYPTAGLNGYMLAGDLLERLIIYRVTNGAAVAGVVVTVANEIVVGTAYTVRIVRRAGGQITLYIRGGAYPDFVLANTDGTGTTNPATDNTYTSGQFFNIGAWELDALSNIKFTRVCERPASFPWEFLAGGTWAGLVSAGTVWARCLTAGRLFIPKDLSWTSCTVGLYKGADANQTDFLFLANELGGTLLAGQSGYCLRLSNDNRIQLLRTTGVETLYIETAPGYVASAIEYQIKIDHVPATHTYTFSIMGGVYAAWTVIFSYVLGIYTEGNYMIWDMDADDRGTAPVFNT